MDTPSRLNREELIQRISETALLRGEFTLRSGKKSNYYLDKYLFETHGDILWSLGHLFAERLTDDTQRIAGAELGGIPLVTATSIVSGTPAIFIRNQKKEYGTAKQIEGELNPDDRIMIVEDVATTGGQVLEAAQTLAAMGAKITKIVAVIDREEGAESNITSAGYAFESLFTKTDLGVN